MKKELLEAYALTACFAAMIFVVAFTGTTDDDPRDCRE
jgi:hypothetical protein